MLEFAPLKPQPKEPVINDVLLRRIRNFYETSDIRDAKDAWLDYFDAAADVKIGPFQAARRTDIRRMRSMMWDGVVKRKHWVSNLVGEVDKIGHVHIMLKGAVSKTDHEKRETIYSWAASAVWSDPLEDGSWKMRTYRVWLDEWAFGYDGNLPAEWQFLWPN